jgi:glyoxylase-like metal-dependent hydrolase (beta-lactamase superfamily II)
MTRHRDIESLKTAAAWPGADRVTVVILATKFVAAGLDADGYAYFQQLSDAAPGNALLLALAGFYQARSGGDLTAALAKLDQAATADLGLPQYLRGLALASLPADLGTKERAGQAVTDLEFVLAVRDQFPATLIRAVHWGLAHAYAVLGEKDKAAEAAARSGIGDEPRDTRLLFGSAWVNAADGFRMATPAIYRPSPEVHVAQGYDFGDFAFIGTQDGVIAIDAGTAEHRVTAALADAGFPRDTAITHVIVTHAHYDHVGGIGALLGPGTKVIADAGFGAEQRRQEKNQFPFLTFEGEKGVGGKHAAPDQLVRDRTELSAGGTDLVLLPTPGGETEGALMVYLPASGLLFTGDVMMPYLGAPFFAEGSPEGLLETLRAIRELAPRELIQGHTPLTDLFTMGSLAGLEAALTALREHVLDGIRRGLPLPAILDDCYLPEALRDEPAAVVPYLITREHFAERLYRQQTGYWLPGRHGIEPVSDADRAGALDLLAGADGDGRFVTAAAALIERGDHALALEIIEPGLLRYPGSADLARLRQTALRRLAELNQQLDPFRFLVYAELAGLEIGPVR